MCKFFLNNCEIIIELTITLSVLEILNLCYITKQHLITQKDKHIGAVGKLQRISESTCEHRLFRFNSDKRVQRAHALTKQDYHKTEKGLF